MSLFGSMFSGVSGLGAQSRAMSMISDNVANVNTTGYKGAAAQFSDLVTQSSTKAPYAPGGVRAITARSVEKQGLVQGSGSPTHVAISGNGFFAVNAKADGSGEQVYTRDGAFQPDVLGNLRTPSGFYLRGWKLDENGEIADLNQLTTVATGPLNGVARATTEIELSANLDADAVAYAGAYAAGDMAAGAVPPHFTRNMQVYDSLGRAQDLTVGFLKTGANTWATEAYADPASVDAVAHPGGLIASGDLTFDGTGAFAGSTLAPMPMAVTWDAALGASPSTIDLKLGTVGDTDGVTQFASPSNVAFVKQNGVEAGTLTGVSIDEEGYFSASFTNGETRNLYKLAIATFANPSALDSRSGNVFAKTTASGEENLRFAGTGGAGSLIPSSLEGANVDIAEEFTKMIVTQRAYSANAKIITTANDMLGELMQITR
ncbi:MAG: flagellar hook protein FlgE [Geminicoccaceae bacterium]|nr:flagellar hook protein FlgE [Geminicoccaceae bacterium]